MMSYNYLDRFWKSVQLIKQTIQFEFNLPIKRVRKIKFLHLIRSENKDKFSEQSCYKSINTGNHKFSFKQLGQSDLFKNFKMIFKFFLLLLTASIVNSAVAPSGKEVEKNGQLYATTMVRKSFYFKFIFLVYLIL